MNRTWALILALALWLSACRPSAALVPAAQAPATLTVYAAASLTSAFSEMGTHFEALHPGVKVAFNFAGSQTLRTQIEQGAQADVFAAANTKEMDALAAGKLVGAGSPKIFMTNQLVVILPANNPAGIAHLEDLAKSGLKLVLAAKEVPVGNYSLKVLRKLDPVLGAGYQQKVLANVVSYENDVKQVVTKVQLGEGDAGIVYTSDCVAVPALQKIEIPAAENVVAQYPIAALSQARNPALAQAFIAYVFSPDGQAILKKWGFAPVQ